MLRIYFFSHLTKRSEDPKINIFSAVMEDNLIYIEREMTISRKNPGSVLYGSSRLTLNGEGKITEQRDYYDCGARLGKAYRGFINNHIILQQEGGKEK